MKSKHPNQNKQTAEHEAVVQNPRKRQKKDVEAAKILASLPLMWHDMENLKCLNECKKIQNCQLVTFVKAPK